MKTFESVNSKDFEQKTLHYRTSANHSVPPNFEVGEGIFVTRYMVPLTTMQPNGDGSFNSIDDLNQPRIAYGFGGVPPLKIADVVIYCTEQHLAANACYQALQSLINEIIAKVKAVTPSPL